MIDAEGQDTSALSGFGSAELANLVLQLAPQSNLKS
jgi:hypothetical protein